MAEADRREVFLRLAASMREAVTWSMDGTTPHINHAAVLRLPSGCHEPVYESYSEQYVRCRKCPGCAWAKRGIWIRRMVRESRGHARAWFVTLTFREGAAPDYDAVQRYLKRVRKACGDAIRYVVTLEAGSLQGRLHYHLVVYGPMSVRWRDLCHTWASGFSSAKLIKNHLGAFKYVAKYLSKAGGRIRASKGFGADRPASAVSDCAADASCPRAQDATSVSVSTNGAERDDAKRRSLKPDVIARWHTGYTPVCIALWFQREGAVQRPALHMRGGGSDGISPSLGHPR